MSEADFSKLFVALIWILFLVCGLMVMFVPEVQKHLARKKLKTIIAKSLASSIDLSFEDFKLLVSSNNLSRYEASKVLQRALLDAYEQADANRVALIKTYLQLQKTEEPYENIPGDIKLNLEHVKTKLGEDGAAALSPLVSTLQKYGIKERKSRLLNWMLGAFSFVATVIGLFLSLKGG